LHGLFALCSACCRGFSGCVGDNRHRQAEALPRMRWKGL
jgi:hypothetical protein